MVRDGYFYALALLAVAVLIHILTGGWVWTALPLLFAAFFLWFFRDPQRAIPEGEGLVVSPADGKVTEVARIRTPDGEKIRISIFLNVFNVHVNRAPVAGAIREVRYSKGKFLNAMNPASAIENEQNLAVIASDEGYEISLKQIAGLLARRIVFSKRVGERLERGERLGMMKFGSRTDVVLPGFAEVLVQVGHHVKGGSDLLARIPAAELPTVTDEADAGILV
ncbi:phosphatidylserine decarboxylase family protein [Paracidobacterium acidisoli]|uniref:Phosphatidylserine decarboxylase proenzyme n=1 Tax=Paracidobacterium acidisoli TaxID=2303751 RepID=A0A372IUB6_9BACT|nr:phosphatidylserine decarboxylase family protein [Paracidobacterium acidisoli]MBT9329425.1 phosphatidylserine decarboxylase family protein [Paracidobacterium acidisoli]